MSIHREVKQVESDLQTFALLQEYEAIRREKQIRTGASNRIDFCESVLKDEKGKHIVLAPLHKSWHWHVDYCWSRGVHPVLVAPWGHGKCCFKSDTYITMTDGSKKLITDITSNDKVLAFNKQLNFVPSLVKDISDNGERAIFELKTRTGRKIKTTVNHPFYCIDGWKILGRLGVGDRIAVPRSYNMFYLDFIPNRFHPDLAEFLGYMVGDGCCVKDNLEFTNKDESVVSRFVEICKQFGWRVRKDGISYHVCRDGSITSPKELVKKYGIDKLAKHKTVPAELFTATNSDVAKFLGAYFCCDGEVSLHNGMLGIGSASQQLAKDVHYLLLRFGIVSHYFETVGKWKGKTYPDYGGVRIYGYENIKKFYENIPIYHLPKKEKIGKWLRERESKPRNSNIDLIPNGWWNFTRRNIWSLAYEHQFCFNKYKSGTNRSKVQQVAELDDNDYLRDVCQEHLLWDEIVELNEVGAGETVNFEVEHFHTYIANDIITHNSVGMVIGGSLYDLGENPAHRVKVVCNSDDSSKGRVKSVSRYIEFDEDFHAIYPNCRPAVNTEAWTTHELFVERPASVRSIDPSLQAKGIFSTGIGGRADFLIFDDPVDRRNSIDYPEMRKRLPEVFFDTWVSRLEPGGKMLYIATVWHIEDLTHILMGETGYCVMRQAVTEDFSKIKADFINLPDDEHPIFEAFQRKTDVKTATVYVDMPLWEAKWNKKELIKRYGTTTTSQRAFERGFRQKPFTSTELTFPSIDKCLRFGMKVADVYVKKSWYTFVGVDLSGKRRPGNAIFTLGYNCYNGKKAPVDIRYGAWTSPQVAQQLNFVYKKFEPLVIMVEDNGIQESIIQWIQMYSQDFLYWDRVLPYTTTGSVKRSIVGLPSLEVEFSNEAWDVYFDKRHTAECQCGYCLWVTELRTYPFGKSEDLVMASWFAREACRQYLLEGETEEEWLSPSDLNVETGQFGILDQDLVY